MVRMNYKKRGESGEWGGRNGLRPPQLFAFRK